MSLLDLWAESGWAAAVDTTVLTARGGVWHKKACEAGSVGFVHPASGRIIFHLAATVNIPLFEAELAVT